MYQNQLDYEYKINSYAFVKNNANLVSGKMPEKENEVIMHVDDALYKEISGTINLSNDISLTVVGFYESSSNSELLISDETLRKLFIKNAGE